MLLSSLIHITLLPVMMGWLGLYGVLITMMIAEAICYHYMIHELKKTLDIQMKDFLRQTVGFWHYWASNFRKPGFKFSL